MQKTKTGQTYKRYISRVLVALFIFTLLCGEMALQYRALAADRTLYDGEELDLNMYASNAYIDVAAGASVLIYDSDNTTSERVNIACGAGSTLTLNNVNIDGSIIPIKVTGKGCTLILRGTNTLKSGYETPGILVDSNSALEIKGDGSLTAIGGDDCAGIGGKDIDDCGDITISGGTVNATGGSCGAGIGCGNGGDRGVITISGGTVNATGGSCGAGIGGRRFGTGGVITISGGTVNATGGTFGAGIGRGDSVLGTDDYIITISGGTVNATGGSQSAGIGGGNRRDGGTITISGGTVTATGGSDSAGIGGGYYGDGGTITISGGTVFAARGGGARDIGPGYHGSGGTFNLSGDAAVFLRNDSCLAPVTSTHTHCPQQTAVNGQLYGYDLPDGWSAAGIYALVYRLTYDDNGGTGGESVLIPMKGTAAIIGGDSLSNPGYIFTGWNTQADGNGMSYAPGDSIEAMTSHVVLYAMWRVDDGAMISGVTPGGSGAPTSGNIVATFIDTMDTSAAGTVSLDGNALAGGSWSNYGKTYTVPYSGLSYNQSYTISISGFKNSYGETMPDTSHNFTTAAPAKLQSLSVDTGALNQPFDVDTVVYSVDASGINSIGVTAVTEDPGASLTINGIDTDSGTKRTVSLENGKNLIPVVVTSQDGAVQNSYVLSVNGTVSDADLGSLTLTEGTLNFSAAMTDYYVTVGSTVASVDLKASASDAKAVMLLDGAILTQGGTAAIPLSPGDNTVTLMVIAQDATTKTYTVTINRGNSDATLTGLTLSDGVLSPAFNRTTYAYTATVAHSVTDLTVTPTAADSGATVTVNGQDASTAVDLTVGVNTLTVLVTGSDGVTTKTYTIEVTRQAAVTITNAKLPVGIIGGAYSVTMSSTGGDGSFTWNATGLPSSNNLSLDSATGVLSGTPASGDEGTYTVTITATDTNAVTGTETYTLVIQLGCGGGTYTIVSDGDPAYTGSYTADGIPTLTVSDGVSGYTYFRVYITPVTNHAGTEVCVFVHTRGGKQLGFSFSEADYDTVGAAGAAFDVQPGDVIRVYIVDALTNSAAGNPSIL